MQRLFLFLLFIVTCGGRLMAQTAPLSAARTDTLRVTISEAEKLFTQNNLSLLSQKIQVNAAEAAIIQARLFNNPTISVEQNIYNPQNNREFDVSKSGQLIVQVQQLFQLAGKRNKRIAVEQLNARLTEYQYFDLLRSLRFELRTSMLELSFLLQNSKIYSDRIEPVRKLVNAFETQYNKGNVALKEVTRLKALIFSLENQRLDLLTQINQHQADLGILLHVQPNVFVLPVINQKQLDQASTQLNLPELLQTATQNRFDLKIYETGIAQQEANVVYQKSLAVPDLTLGGVYDRQGSFVRDYTGLQAAISLPVFNRNQGGIKIADQLLQKSKLDYEQYQNQVEQDVVTAYNHAVTTNKLYSNFDAKFSQDFDKLMTGITSSFSKRNISLIEFIDYYETYTESISQMLQLQTNRARALEEVNFAVGTPILKLDKPN
ncbi:TolC family protein [Adhaeribacter radiodurans]|uniref:TolC family protein n=1 Tax=Adhaeribacter radiodurans TaxID=2745197 RepID=A0A7L7L9M4_9BACT|nr:TolC family protein [Adhaeribacter radiodurans]QMU29552.1 TolC family protein [Adhaeribacter radiodurans]